MLSVLGVVCCLMCLVDLYFIHLAGVCLCSWMGACLYLVLLIVLLLALLVLLLLLILMLLIPRQATAPLHLTIIYNQT